MPVRSDFAPGEFCWIDLSTNDLESALTWYGELFDWAHQKMESPGGAPPYAFLTKGAAAVGGMGELSPEMKANGVPPMWNSYVSTDDCEATEAKVKELGGVVAVPTMDVPGHGKLAFFVDPEGASFAAWQSTGSEGPGMLINEHGGLSWNELMYRDSETTMAFYGALHGWEFKDMPMGEADYKMLRCGDKDAGGMMKMEGAQFEGIPAHWLIYFNVTDCGAVAAKVEATGGKVNVPPTEIPVGSFSVFADPQGAFFAVISLNDTNCE